MARPPYMNFPFPPYKNPQFYSYNNFIKPQKPTRHKTNETEIVGNTSYKDLNKENLNLSSNLNEKNKSNKYADDYLFDLFGLKIYNDDVLLVSLIYFLYSEGVQDDSLFLVLILLLLS